MKITTPPVDTTVKFTENDIKRIRIIDEQCKNEDYEIASSLFKVIEAEKEYTIDEAKAILQTNIDRITIAHGYLVGNKEFLKGIFETERRK